MPLPLAELFADEDYRFRLKLRQARVADYFGSPDPDVLAERRRTLAESFEHHAGWVPRSEPLLDAFESLVAAADAAPRAVTPVARLRRLGSDLVPDFLLLRRKAAGTPSPSFQLRAAIVCFPSSWRLADKIGQPLHHIHSLVPGLNTSLAPTIDRFLSALKPGAAVERSNWGLAATPERNMHPRLDRPRLLPPADLDRIWLRIEDQLVAPLPGADGILFAIALRILPLGDVTDDPLLRNRFVRALATMPEPMAAYKGIAAVRPSLLDRLGR
jgi:hypothetical protein